MQPVRTITGKALPLDRSDVDTDAIIPAEWLKRVERTGFGQGLFSAWRADPNFVLNSDAHKGAKILVAGPNFGIGSSREHAVWALEDYGFQAVVSARFADIFRNNCTKVGLVPAEVEPYIAEQLLKAIRHDPELQVTVDVDQRVVRAPDAGIEGPFRLDDFARERLLQGLDDIGLSLRHVDAIAAFEAARADWLPTVDVP